MSQTIDIQTEGGEFSAYVANPAESAAPVVVVLHEVFGATRTYGRSGVNWEWKNGLALYTAYNRDTGVRDVIAAVRAAERLGGATGKVGVMGFCLGGLMTYVTAARHDLDATVAYHSGDTEELPWRATPLPRRCWCT
jgi:carboxymethylenebutenolidase